MTTPARTALALAALLAAHPATAGEGLGLTLQAWGGASRYDAGGLSEGIANQGRDLLQSRVTAYGASALLRLGALDLGLLYEGSLVRSRTDAIVITPVAGLAIPLGEALRLDLLGELGGHRISDVQFSGSVDVSQARAVWLPFLGVRPTLTVRLPLGGLHVALSAAPFARWDLLHRSTTLEVGGSTVSTRSYSLGGTTFGLVAGAGIEL